jgi:DNA-binding transcriptional regulator YhcF (GntR family)
MKFHIDRQSRLPYPTQVQRQATAQLIAGRLHPGERMPSVRQLARELAVSKTTAERIHAALLDATLVEVRPRSGVFAAHVDAPEQSAALQWAQVVFRFLEETADRARDLGLTPGRLGTLLQILDEQKLVSGRDPVVLPIVATRDAFECMTMCLPADFPARLQHVPPTTEQTLTGHPRYLLCGYYLRDRARLLAERAGCSMLHVRYNVTLLDEAMNIPLGEHRHFITRDRDNAETTRGLLASAYPEVPQQRYTVAPAAAWLAEGKAVSGKDQVWSTITAASLLSGVDPARVRVMHPILADDFIEELRCLALFLQSEAGRG